MMKKILFILPDTEMGGAERQAVLLAKSMCDEYKVDFLCFHFDNRKYKVPEALSSSNVNVEVIESLFPQNRFHRLFRLCQLAHFCLFKHYYAAFPYLYEMCLNIGMLRRLKLFMVEKLVWNQRDEGFGGRLNKFNGAILSSFEVFISNSIGGCEFLQHNFLVPIEKIHYVKNGVEIRASKTRNAWRLENDFQDGEFLACMLANIHQNKDHVTVIRAIKFLINEGVKIKMLFVGYEGNTIDIVRQCIKENNVEDNVILYGSTKDVGSLLHAMDASVLSSPSEGLSNTMLESMAMKVPFIGTRIAGITNVLGTDYPLLFDVGKANQLAQCLKIILKDKEFVQNIVDSNSKLIERDFSVNRLRTEILSLIG